MKIKLPPDINVETYLFKNFTLKDIAVFAMMILIAILMLVMPIKGKGIALAFITPLFVLALIKFQDGRGYEYFIRFFDYGVSRKEFSKEDYLAENQIQSVSNQYFRLYSNDIVKIVSFKPKTSIYINDGERKLIEAKISSFLTSIDGVNMRIVKMKRNIEYKDRAQEEIERAKILADKSSQKSSCKTLVKVVQSRLDVLNEIAKRGLQKDALFILFIGSEKVVDETLENFQKTFSNAQILEGDLLVSFIKSYLFLEDGNACFSENEEDVFKSDLLKGKANKVNRNRICDVAVGADTVRIGGSYITHYCINKYPIYASYGYLNSILDIDTDIVEIRIAKQDSAKAVRKMDKAALEIATRQKRTRSQEINEDVQDESVSDLIYKIQQENQCFYTLKVLIRVRDDAPNFMAKVSQNFNNVNSTNLDILTDKNLVQTPDKNGIFPNEDDPQKEKELLQEKQFNKKVAVAKSASSIVSRARSLASNSKNLYNARRVSFLLKGLNLGVSKMQFAQGYAMRYFPSRQVIESNREVHHIKSLTTTNEVLAKGLSFFKGEINEESGLLIGDNPLPVYLNLFKRNTKYLNSNCMVIGSSGSGKSYAVKTLIANMATENIKIYVLDPEGEYEKLANSLGGQNISIGSSEGFALNPFYIPKGANLSLHLQFLDEFFKISCSFNSREQEILNNQISLMYSRRRITQKNLDSGDVEHYPNFEKLVETLEIAKKAEENQVDIECLNNLVIQCKKFQGSGREASLYAKTLVFDEEPDVTCFNFSTLFQSKNQNLINTQMLLTLKHIESMILKNNKNGYKTLVVVDEAHLFFSEENRQALDFMYQLAKRIRKYNGMQIVVTQSIKDFTASKALQKKTQAIINASQYSFIFPLHPADINELKTLYSVGLKLSDLECETITKNERGTAYLISSPTNKDNIKIYATPYVRELFE